MRRIKVYLDTSVISSYFDERVPDFRIHTSRFFERLETFDVYVSDLVIAELQKTRDVQRKKELLDCADKFIRIPLSEEALTLAEMYIKNGAIPGNYKEDALHIACAAIQGVDYLLSWNFEHLVRMKTRKIVDMVHSKNGYPLLQISTPAELL